LLYFIGAALWLRIDAEVMMKHLLMLAAFSLAAVGSAAAQTQTPPAQAPLPGAPPCDSCGVVQSVHYVEKQGQGSGVGLVAGGVVGGLLGNQIGSGRGNTAATIVGAGAGAYAGNQVEKNAKKTSYWVVAVRLDDGSHKSITSGSQPAFKKGDRVKIVDGKRLALIAN
jgi:outer membrane lipoprotein SlyB